MKKSSRRNFLRSAAGVLGALAICPAVLIPKEGLQHEVRYQLILIMPDGSQQIVEGKVVMTDGGKYTSDWRKIK